MALLGPDTPENTLAGGLFSFQGGVQNGHRVCRSGQTAPAPGPGGWQQALPGSGSKGASRGSLPRPWPETPENRAGAALPQPGWSSRRAPELPQPPAPTPPLAMPTLGDGRPGPAALPELVGRQLSLLRGVRSCGCAGGTRQSPSSAQPAGSSTFSGTTLLGAGTGGFPPTRGSWGSFSRSGGLGGLNRRASRALCAQSQCRQECRLALGPFGSGPAVALPAGSLQSPWVDARPTGRGCPGIALNW